jgi:hypothetical protein
MLRLGVGPASFKFENKFDDTEPLTEFHVEEYGDFESVFY